MRNRSRQTRSSARTADEHENATTTPTITIAAPVEQPSTTKEKSIMSQLADHALVQAAAPFVGAAGGALAATIAVERFGMRREFATLGGAVLAIAAAQGQSGLVRSALEGAAMAGVCLGVVEILQNVRPSWIFTQPKPDVNQHRQAAPPPDSITRADLAAALSELHLKQQAENLEREKQELERTREMQSMIRDLIERLRVANAEIHMLRAAEAAHQHQRDAHAADAAIAAANTPIEDIAPVEETSAAIATDETEPEEHAEEIVDTAELPTPSSTESISPETLAHFRAIYALLDETEHEKLKTLVGTTPKDVVARTEDYLMTLSPSDAVAYLRSNVFPSVRAQA